MPGIRRATPSGLPIQSSGPKEIFNSRDKSSGEHMVSASILGIFICYVKLLISGQKIQFCGGQKFDCSGEYTPVN